MRVERMCLECRTYRMHSIGSDLWWMHV